MITEGWWFGSANDRLPHGDGRLAKVGRTHHVKGQLVPCRNALHMAYHAADALPNASGLILWRVVGSGQTIAANPGILACRSRKYLARIDATTTILAWARRCASDVLHLWDAPQVVRHFLATGEEPYAATRATPWSQLEYASRIASYATEYAANAVAYAACGMPHAAGKAALASVYAAAHAATPMELRGAEDITREKYALWLDEDCTALLTV